MDVRFPNGTIVQNVPEGISKADLLSKLKANGYNTESLLAAPTPEPTQFAGFTGSFGEALTQSGRAGVEAGKFAADQSEANRKALLEASKSKYKQMDFEQAQNIPEYWEALKELAGGSFGQMAAPLATAAGVSALATPVAGIAAGFSVGAGQYAVSDLIRTAQEQQAAIDRGEKPNPVDLGKLAAASIAQSGLDVLEVGAFKRLFKLFPGMGKVLGEGGEQATETELKKLVESYKRGDLTYGKKFGIGIAKGAGFEMPQEVAQQALERWQAGLSLTDEDARNEYKNAAVGALVLGGAAGGASNVVKNASDIYQAKQEEAKDDEAKRKAAELKKAIEGAATAKEPKAEAETGTKPPAEEFKPPSSVEGVDIAEPVEITDRILSILRNSEAVRPTALLTALKKTDPNLTLEQVKAYISLLQTKGLVATDGKKLKYAGPDAAPTLEEIAALNEADAARAAEARAAEAEAGTEVKQSGLTPAQAALVGEARQAAERIASRETLTSPRPVVSESVETPPAPPAAENVYVAPELTADSLELSDREKAAVDRLIGMGYSEVDALRAAQAKRESAKIKAKNESKRKPKDSSGEATTLAAQESELTEHEKSVQAILDRYRKSEQQKIEKEALARHSRGELEMFNRNALPGEGAFSDLEKQASRNKRILAQYQIGVPEEVTGAQNLVRILHNMGNLEFREFNKLRTLIEDKGVTEDVKNILNDAVVRHLRPDMYATRDKASAAERAAQKALDEEIVGRRVQSAGSNAPQFKSTYESQEDRVEGLEDRLDALDMAASLEDADNRAHEERDRNQRVDAEAVDAYRELFNATLEPEAAESKDRVAKFSRDHKLDLPDNILATPEGREHLQLMIEELVENYESLITASRVSPTARKIKKAADNITKKSTPTRSVYEALRSGNMNNVIEALLLRYEDMQITGGVDETGESVDIESGSTLSNIGLTPEQETIRDLLNSFANIDLSNIKVVTEGTRGQSSIFDKMQRKGMYALYDPKTNQMFFSNNGMNERIILHELVHATTVQKIRQFETDPSSMDSAEREAVEHLNNLYTEAKNRLSEQYGAPLENVYEFLSYALTDKKFQKSLAKINIPDLSKYTKSPVVNKHRSIWDQLIESIAKMFGLAKGADGRYAGNLLVETASVMDRIMAPPTAGVDLGILAARERKKAAANLENGSQYEDRREQNLRNLHQGNRFTDLVRHMFRKTPDQNAYERMVTAFQNDRRPLQVLQDTLRRAGKLIIGGEGFNDVYGQLVRSSQLAELAFRERVELPRQKMYRAIDAYAKKNGFDTIKAMARLDRYLMALHEMERRLVKYIRNVPLNNTQRLKIKALDPKEDLTAAGWRDWIYRQLYGNNDLVSKKIRTTDGRTISMAEYYREILEKTLVANFKDASPTGSSPNKTKSLDMNSLEYNVIGQHDEKFFAETLKDIEADPAKSELAAVQQHMRELQDATIEMDRESNYWSKPVDNIAAFYGYKNYVPFKGKTASQVSKGDSQFEYGGERLGGEFSEYAREFEGRESDSDNVLTQTVADSVKAALRVGRKDVMRSLYNAMQQEHIATRRKKRNNEIIAKKIPFSERYNGDVDIGAQRGANKHFLYEPDGTIRILEVTNPVINTAIRRAYTESNDFLVGFGKLTSAMSKMHTRYNIGFHPYNFVRDTLTNAGVMSAEKGGAAGARYLKAVASAVANGGFMKASRMSKAYANNDIAEMRRLAAADKTGFSQNVLEWIENGGRSAYLMGVAQQSQIKELVRELGPSGIAKTKEQIDKYMDIWGDTFEFTSRAAAYAAAKADALERNLKQGMPPAQAEAAAKQEAATYAKELTNFESVGRYGKEAGSLFMFFRPAATGAIRTLDALLPAIQKVDSLVERLPDSIKNDPAALAKFKESFLTQQQNARTMIALAIGAGIAMYLMSLATAGDDEQKRNKVATDDMAIWTRNLRLPIPGTDKFMQIPWGFGLGAFASAGAQIMALASGNQSVGDAGVNLSRIYLDSFLPLPISQINPTDKPLQWVFDSIMPSALRPPLEFMMDTDSLGRQIYNNRQSKYGEAYTGGINVPEMYRDLTRKIVTLTNGEVNVQPDTLYFFANNYVDGFSKLVHGLYGTGLALQGEKTINWKTDIPGFSSFLGKQGNIDAREYENSRAAIEKAAGILRMFESRPEEYQAYIRRNPAAASIVQMFNATESALKPLQQADKQVNAMDVSADQRKEYHDQLVLLQNMYRRNFLDTLKSLGY